MRRSVPVPRGGRVSQRRHVWPDAGGGPGGDARRGDLSGAAAAHRPGGVRACVGGPRARSGCGRAVDRGRGRRRGADQLDLPGCGDGDRRHRLAAGRPSDHDDRGASWHHAAPRGCGRPPRDRGRRGRCRRGGRGHRRANPAGRALTRALDDGEGARSARDLPGGARRRGSGTGRRCPVGGQHPGRRARKRGRLLRLLWPEVAARTDGLGRSVGSPRAGGRDDPAAAQHSSRSSTTRPTPTFPAPPGSTPA